MPSKMVTNYDSMFSDLPNYPRQHEVTWNVPGHSARQTCGEVNHFIGVGGDVTGRDRSKFFKRPILPNAMPMPYIRYAKEISQSEEDVDKRRQRYRQGGAKKSFDEIDFGKNQFTSKVSFGTQTDFREIEVQTEPCTISYENDEVIRRKPEVTSLSILKHGRGLPIKTFDDLDLVDELRRQRALEMRLPASGDPRRPVMQRAILQRRQTVEVALDQKCSNNRIGQRTRQMQSDVRYFGDASHRQLDERLERLWRHKQQEKEDRMRVIRKIHEKEQKSLEKKCQDLNNFIHRGTFKKPPSYQDRLSRSADGDSEFTSTIPPYADPVLNRPRTSSRLRRIGGLDDEFLTTYNGLRSLEKETSNKLASVSNVGRRQQNVVKKVVDKKPVVFPEGYVKRGDRYRHTLDTAFDDIVAKKKQEKEGSQMELDRKKKQQLYDYFRMPRQPETSTVHDEKPSTRFIDTKTSKKYNEANLEQDLQRAQEVRKEVEKIRERVELKMDSFVDQNVVEHGEEFVDAFMDEIEGETLGQMLNYLSSELESSAEEQIISKQNVDHIFEEISKVTQSTVDRYLDTILLDTLYRHAGRSAQRETERSDPDGERRCSSASGVEEGKTRIMTENYPTGGLGIKQRIKEFQRQHLLAAGEALYAVLAELKVKGEVRRDNRDEVELNIREALEDFCKPEHLEKELRKAMSHLNIDSLNKE